MKIRNRLSLQFSGLFTILLLGVLVAVYFVVSNHWQNTFFKQLEDRAFTVGHNYLAEDNFTKAEFDEVLRKYPRTLPQEEIRIYDINYEPTFIEEGDLKWDKATLGQVVDKKKVYTKMEDDYVVGIFYRDNSGDFIVMAKAANEKGVAALQQLRTVMLISLVIALLITFFLSRLFAGYFLIPITRINKHISKKNISTLYPIPTQDMSKDEIRILSETINELFRRLQDSFDNQQAFVSHASHELKTPIASLMGNAEIALRQSRSEQEYITVLQGVVHDATHMDQMINNLLALSQLDSSVYPLHKHAFEEFWWTMIDHLIAAQKDLNLEITINTDQELHKLFFNGNGGLLELALSNVILNASKFSQNEPIELILDTDKDNIIVMVKDQGIGIKKEDLDKLFLPFYRSSNAFGIKGTGLGLSLASKIVQLHKGQLTIDSELAAGTTVVLKIPKSV
ncbi:HAMP domain-containing histidine kinase [Myroides sp. M-43]|uniref:sensor histidine kinase n=1 Tax=Myroides oncorhynchi TaxID=2893756 RepID=UPI001E2D57A1|nr:HAMP domain-containing sensor histidine kinase [Myroides oncorhynchi]MCC9043278.1 HAMP domain-containing histidine kinase [Myroides oncorhynchi]